jgi:penicillin-binding protein 2
MKPIRWSIVPISCLPPGSTFKLITSLAGLRGTKNLAGAKFSCGGGVSYGDHFFSCWVAKKHYTHGTIGVADALKVSCDSFFYQYGNAASIQSIDHVGKMLGMGEESGFATVWRTNRQYAWARVDANSPSPGEVVTGANRPMFQSVRATRLFRPCNWQWPTWQSQMAASAITHVLIDKVLNQDGSPVLDEKGNPAAPPPRVQIGICARKSPLSTSNWFARAFGRSLTKMAAQAAERV